MRNSVAENLQLQFFNFRPPDTNVSQQHDTIPVKPIKLIQKQEMDDLLRYRDRKTDLVTLVFPKSEFGMVL